jgi:calcineurin-like phosphoesterase family protein
VVLLALAFTMSPAAAAAQDPVIAAAGDIACAPDDPNFNGGAGIDGFCRQRATSDLLVGTGLTNVLALGDIQYNSASLANITAVYEPTWGRVKSITRPVIGNHEGSGAGYYDYFNGPGVLNGPAGVRGKGWYSFDVGTWHVVALNSNCAAVACTAGSEQEQWLRADLAAHPTSCTLAFWHHPRYSSGHDDNGTFMQPLWEALDDAGAEIVLSGHSHDYERVAPVDRNGNVDPAEGIRQFVVGTGGAFFTGGLGTRIPQSEVAQNDTFGVLFLTLHPTSYDWRFVPEAGRTFTDAGTTACHRLIPPPPPPPPAADVTAPVISNVTLSPRRFAVAAKGGATLRYALSEAATVTVAVVRRSAGRKVAGTCRRRTRANRKRPRCIRLRPVGGFSLPGVTGSNSRRFSGRLGERRLRPGRYRADLVATDAAGNRSKSASVRFTVVRRRGAR